MLVDFVLGISVLGFGLLAYHQFSSLNQVGSGLLLSVIALGQSAILLRKTAARQRVFVLAAFAAFALGIIAQYRQTMAHIEPGILGLAAALLWIAFLVQPATRRSLLASRLALPQALQLNWRRIGLLLLGAGQMLTSYLLAKADGRISLPLLICWLSGIAVWWAALREPDAPSFSLPRLTLKREHLLLFGILLIGGLSFYYGLDQAPAGMLGDHAAKLRDIEGISKGIIPIYFSDNFGREPIHFYLSYAATALVGYNFMSLKIVSATVAMLTLLALYWAGRQIDGRLTGLLAMGLGALSLWLMIMGRNGFRAGEAALATALLIGALWRALHSGRRVDFLLAGLILGLGMYTYTAFRMMPLLVILGVGLRLFNGPPGSRGRLLLNAAALVAVAFMVYVPLFGYWQYDPQGYWHRTDHLFHDAHPERLWFGFHRALGIFNLYGDVVWFNAVPGRPALGPVAGALLLFGVALWLWRALLRRRAIELLLPLGLMVCVLPSALAVGAPIELPNALRSVTAIPVALLIGASALAFTLRMCGQHASRPMGVVFGLLILALHGGLNWDAYFNHFAAHYNRQVARELHTAQQIREFEQSGGSIWNAYFVSDDGFLPTHGGTIAAELGYPTIWQNWIGEVNIEDCQPMPEGRPLFLVIHYWNTASGTGFHEWLANCFDHYRLEDYFYAPGDKLFETVWID